jgi:hypothetical protein
MFPGVTRAGKVGQASTDDDVAATTDHVMVHSGLNPVGSCVAFLPNASPVPDPTTGIACIPITVIPTLSVELGMVIGGKHASDTLANTLTVMGALYGGGGTVTEQQQQPKKLCTPPRMLAGHSPYTEALAAQACARSRKMYTRIHRPLPDMVLMGYVWRCAVHDIVHDTLWCFRHQQISSPTTTITSLSDADWEYVVSLLYTVAPTRHTIRGTRSPTSVPWPFWRSWHQWNLHACLLPVAHGFPVLLVSFLTLVAILHGQVDVLLQRLDIVHVRGTYCLAPTVDDDGGAAAGDQGARQIPTLAIHPDLGRLYL